MRKAVFFILVVFVMLGCNDPRIDTSSEKKMVESIAKVRESLPEEKREDFDKAFKVVAVQGVNVNSIFDLANVDFEAEMKKSLNGKTGKEVIAEADRILQERAEAQRQQAIEEIKELRKKKMEAEAAREELAAFKVTRSRFYIEKSDFLNQPIIELDVENNTTYPISRAYFKGTLASPGRAVPWHQDDFNYSISGGIEPGEQAHWRMAPNMFSGWGTIKAPADAIFTVEVVRLDGPDGNAVLSSEFSERDSKRLEELLKTYPGN